MSAPELQVLSVNIGQPTTYQVGPRNSSAPKVSGIDKRPLPGRVRVTEEGLEGDHIFSTKHHGGPDQAVYLYTQEDYAHWEAQLGGGLTPGLFGENLLVSGLESPAMRVGDRLEVGEGSVLLEVTAPRIPCATLAAHMGDPAFVKKFVRMARPGFYTRVLRGGEVGPGDSVRLIPGPADAPSIADLFALRYHPSPAMETLAHYLKFPLAVRLRADLKSQLAKGQ